MWVGVAAVTCQLSSTTRGAAGSPQACLGIAFALSGIGNMTRHRRPGRPRVTSAWPAWLSPIGWGQQMMPFADNRWWPVALAWVLMVALFGVAVVLAGRRDVGRGMWPERRGAPHATRRMLSPSGLVWRLQRGTVLGWSVALIGNGLIFGALSDQIRGLKGEATEWYANFGGDADLLGAYWASMMQIAGTAVAVYVVTLLLRLHYDETQGTLEAVLGTAVSRLRWLGAYAANALVGATALMLVFAVAMAVTGGQVLGDTGPLLRDLVGAALVQLPAIAVVGAAVVVLVVMLPRWSVGGSWVVVVFVIFVGPMFGPSLGLPGWLLDLSPFSHVPNAPVVAVGAGPVVGLTMAGALLVAAGVWWLQRRDLRLPL